MEKSGAGAEAVACSKPRLAVAPDRHNTLTRAQAVAVTVRICMSSLPNAGSASISCLSHPEGHLLFSEVHNAQLTIQTHTVGSDTGADAWHQTHVEPARLPANHEQVACRAPIN